MRVWVTLNEDAGTARVCDLAGVKACQDVLDVDVTQTGGLLSSCLFLLTDDSNARVLVQSANEIAIWCRGRTGLRVDVITMLHGVMH